MYTFELVKDLPNNFDKLVADSKKDGYTFLERMAKEFVSGENCFDKPGEILLAVYADNVLAGIGGLNQDPYNPGVLRLRHVYILRKYRGLGLGKQLVLALLAAAAGKTEVVTLRSADEQSSSFYEHLGFQRANNYRATSHIFVDVRSGRN